MSRGLSWVLVALAGLALLAGCGESEQAKYTSKMKSITRQLTKDEKATTGGQRPQSLPEASTQFKRLQAVFINTAKRFQEVKPPAKVKDLHQRLIDLIRTFGEALTPAIQAADAGNLERFRSSSTAFTGGLSTFQSQLEAIRRDYRARGYKLK
jgi:hypothetical protein